MEISHFAPARASHSASCHEIESEVKPEESPGNKNCCHGDATGYNWAHFEEAAINRERFIYDFNKKRRDKEKARVSKWLTSFLIKNKDTGKVIKKVCFKEMGRINMRTQRVWNNAVDSLCCVWLGRCKTARRPSRKKTCLSSVMGWQAENETSSLKKAPCLSKSSRWLSIAAENIQVQIRSKATQSTWQGKHQIEYSAGSSVA
jgi:hypothetical protein